ncbi:hypothetical protein MT418_8470 [Batrachochytrium dendrobatidis]
MTMCMLLYNQRRSSIVMCWLNRHTRHTPVNAVLSESLFLLAVVLHKLETVVVTVLLSLSSSCSMCNCSIG